MDLYIDIDNTICTVNPLIPDKYVAAQPIIDRIAEINQYYDQGKQITYWTARGGHSGIDYTELTRQQLVAWGCKYHTLKMNKPAYDLFIDDKCCNANEYWNKPFVASQHKSRANLVVKGWGHETVFVNNSQYCGKVLHFYKGAKFSMHYHLVKQETWYVASGSFTFLYIDTKDATLVSQKLLIGDVITNKIGQPHQLICDEEGDVFEVSTTHYDSDSYRVLKGDSQQI